MTETIRGLPAYEPTHPGAVLREQILPDLKMTRADAADALGVSRQALQNIMRRNKPAAVSAAMALRLAKFTSTSAQFWINMQTKYDLWHASRNMDLSDIAAADRRSVRARDKELSKADRSGGTAKAVTAQNGRSTTRHKTAKNKVA